MQSLTAPPAATSPGPRATRGRWIWTLSGVVTVALLAVFGSWAFVRSGDTPGDPPPPLSAVPTRTVTISQAVTSLSVVSYGAPIRVAQGPAGQVTVVEAVNFEGQDAPPAVTTRVSHGQLTLDAPSCAQGGCSVGFRVTVPAGVAVNASSEGGEVGVFGATTADLDSGGGPVTARGISGALAVTSEGGSVTAADAGSADLDSGGGPIAAAAISGPVAANADGGSIDVHGTGAATLDSGGGPVNAVGVRGAITAAADGGSITVAGSGEANLDSGGGPVNASAVAGPLTASTDGGELQVDRLTGPLSADTGDGPVNASDISSPTLRITTDGGGATVSFADAPRAVHVTTNGGPALVTLPGGPYAVTAESFGGAEQVTVPASPAAASTVSVSTDGGDLLISPPGSGT
jgi:hypothetical protein